MSKKRKIPWFWRRKAACFCGFVFGEADDIYEREKFFNCPQCNYRWSVEEFWQENNEKWAWNKMREEENYE